MLLSNKYPFLTNYLTTALTADNHPLPQSILFYGNDFESQYTLAKEVARFLNCQKDKSDDCDCLNCRWIREDSHPAVLTISKDDNKPDDDTSKTVISVKQSLAIRESLVNTSEFHRVFIFCDRDDDGNISGLNQIKFPVATANSLLKTIEEPQPGVTFIFLTRYIDDLLSTIVSRSQCFFVPSLNTVDFDYSQIGGIFENYWDFQRKDLFDVSQRLQDLSKTVPVMNILDSIQNYILSVMKSNPKRVDFIEHIKILEDCKKMAKLGIKSVSIFDDLCLKLIK